jgi:hypothetical protein
MKNQGKVSPSKSITQQLGKHNEFVEMSDRDIKNVKSPKQIKLRNQSKT